MHKMKRIIAMCLVLCMLLSVLPISALAVSISISPKPDNGNTEGQPFAPGTGGSQNFRIPGIVTLDDGTLIASCDARWNGTNDSAGLDTIVSVSKDNGATWIYTFANYLGDNGNVRDTNSSCIIDPAIATDGETAYLIADLFPAGFATNSGKYYAQSGSTGFDEAGNLLLRSDAENGMEFGVGDYATQAASATYGYYLKDSKIWTTEGTEVAGYTVDAYFNITGNGINTNLFYADSPYKPFPHDYLYMTTTTDGLNWSEPTLLNLKATTESALLVGPGNGIYDESTGNMVFTAYRHGGGNDERACLIWMDENGNWHRTENATTSGWSSESTVVELNNGTLRVFYRDAHSALRYTDYVWSAEQNDYVRDAEATEVSTTASKTTNNQLTSIKYSTKIDGKDAILVANANGGGGNRRNGYLSVFLVNEDNSMERAYSYDIFPGEDEYYAYNCITEMNDGNIALLYESNNAAITFLTIDMEKVLDRENDPRLTIKEVELNAGYSQVITDNTGYYVDADISELDTDVATLTMTGEEITTNAAQILGSSSNIDLDSCQYTFTATGDGYYEVSADANGTTVYLNHFSTTDNNIPNIATPGKIAVQTSSYENMFKLVAQVIEGTGSGSARGLHFHMEADSPYWDRCGNDASVNCHEYLYRKAADGETASEEIPGYVRITSLDEIVDGGKYLIAAKNDAGNWYVLNPSVSTDKLNHVAQIMGTTTVGTTELTFTGIGRGYTEVVVGSTLYKVTVYGAIKVNLNAGETYEVVDETGYYVDADVSALDTTVATVKLTGELTGYEKVLSENVTAIESGKTYVLYNKSADKLMNNNWADASVGGGGSDGLALSSGKNNVQDNDCWTITAVEGGYYVQDLDGKYASVSRGKALVKDEPVVLSLDFDGTDWTIGENGEYMNNFGNAGSAVAGWSDIDDVNSQWEICEVSNVPQGTTTITFTGVGAGETTVKIGNEIYTITVKNDEPLPHEHVFGDWTVTKEATCTEDGSRERTCECGEKETEVIAALGHGETEVRDDKEATCTEDGYTGDTYCTVCEEKIADGEVIPADGHEYDDDSDPICNNCDEEREIVDPDDPWGKSKWVKVEVDSETISDAKEGNFEYAWDNDLNTIWHSNWKGERDVLTGENTISGTIDFTKEYKINQFSFTPRQDDTGWENGSGVVLQASLYVKDADDTEWKPVAEHAEFEHNQQKKTFFFEEQAVRYVKFVAEKSSYMDRNEGWVVVAEFDIDNTTAPACEHKTTEVRDAKAATCTEDGYTGDTYCADCGEKLADGEVIPSGHTEAEAVNENEKAATCTEAGSYESVVYCSVCDEEISRETVTVPTVNHTEETIPAVEATFDATGLTEGKKCSVCDEILTAQEVVPALNYNEGIIPIEVLIPTAGDWQTGYEATEGPAALALDDDLSTLWHTNWYGTSRDNHWIQFELSEAYIVDGLRYKPRTDLNRQNEPQLNGTITEYQIQVSGDGVNFRTIESGNWDANQNWKVAEFDGIQVKYVRLVAVNACTDNDYVFASAAEIRLTGKVADGSHEHGFGEWTVTENATCTEAGSRERVCECGEKETEVIAALGHTEEIVPGKDATCTEDGLTEGKECSVCGEILTPQEVVPALGHDYENGVCTVCGDKLNPFTDVTEGSYYYDPVLWAVENGITNGVTDTTFNPTGNCKRAQVVTFLWRAFGSPAPESDVNPFTDVEETDYFYNAVLWAVENGITTGTSATEFSPQRECSRAQVVTFLWRAVGEPASDAEITFTDVEANQYYATAVAWAVENGITTGKTATTFDPTGICNRAQVVTFLWRALAE